MIAIDFCMEQDVSSWMRLVQRVSGSFPGLETDDALEQHRCAVLEFMGRREAVAAKAGDTIVGTLLFSRQENVLCFLAVDPDWRRRHIAEKLFFFALPHMTPNKPISVTTWRENAPEGAAARAFYQKLGFLPGRLTEEFGTGVQEFVRPYHALV